MTLGSLLLGLVYYAVAFACLAAFKNKKKSADVQAGLRAYAAAVRSFVRAVIERRTKLPELARAAAPWFGLALLLALLGAVRQLNLQTLLTRAFQSEAIAEGWYDDRRLAQLTFVAGVAIAGLLLAIALLILLRKRLAEVGMPVLAALLLAALLVVRAVSHHHVDALLMQPLLGLARAYWIEALGLLVIGVSALRSIRSRASSSA